jgi:hypothetical protein
MADKKFLETYPLYKKLNIKISQYTGDFGDMPKPAINLNCKYCDSIQTFNMVNEYWENEADTSMAGRHIGIWGKTVRALYECSACNEGKYIFFIEFVKTGTVKEEDSTLDTGYVRKVGQNPPWEIDIESNIEKALGKDAELYKKGLVSESQSYGIGSYAYFRRITENIIDDLLDSILALIHEEEKDKYKQALEKVRETRITEEKIELVQDLLPTSLQPNGINPLKSLHAALSDGIHNKTDDECLDLADTIKTILIYLLEEIRNRNDKAKLFTDKMKKLLDKK